MSDSSPRSSPSHHVNWEDRLKELRRYRAQHGDANVPKGYEPNPSLSHWVYNQRDECQKMKRGEPSAMTAERLAALEKVGFVWRIDSPSAKKKVSALSKRKIGGKARTRTRTIQISPLRASSPVAATMGDSSHRSYAKWENRLEELRDYKAKHGDTNVPQSYGPLGFWVRNQRVEDKKMQEGKPSAMTEARVEALNEIGFAWIVKQRIKQRSWEERLEELRQYRAQHGNTNVPAKYKPNQALSNWAHQQRAEYRKMKEGKDSPMTAEKIAALEEIGFVWRIYAPSASLDELQRCPAQQEKTPRPATKKTAATSSSSTNKSTTTKSNITSAGETGVEAGDEVGLDGIKGIGDRVTTFLSSQGLVTIRDLLDAHTKDLAAAYAKQRGASGQTFANPNAPADAVYGWKRCAQFHLAELRKQRPPSSSRGGKADQGGSASDAMYIGEYEGGNEEDSNRYETKADGTEAENEVDSVAVRATRRSSRRVNWEDRLKELRHYKAQHGDANVPQRYEPNPSFARWVNFVRVEYKKMKKGKRSAMTAERVASLEKMGFVRKSKRGPRRISGENKSAMYPPGTEAAKDFSGKTYFGEDELGNEEVRDRYETNAHGNEAENEVDSVAVVSPSSIEAIGETLAHPSSRRVRLSSRCGVNRNVHNDQAGFDTVASDPDDDGRKKSHASKKEGFDKRKRSLCDQVEFATIVPPAVTSPGMSFRDDNHINDENIVDDTDLGASYSGDNEISDLSTPGGAKRQGTGREEACERKRSRRAGQKKVGADATAARWKMEASTERSSREQRETEQQQAAAMAEAVEAARKEWNVAHQGELDRIQTRMTDYRNRLQAQIDDAQKETKAARSEAFKAQNDLAALKDSSRKELIELTAQSDAELLRVRGEMETKQTALTKEWKELESAIAARHGSELQSLREGVVAQVAAAEERARAEAVEAHRAELDKIRNEAGAAVTKEREEVEHNAQTNINALKERVVDLTSELERVQKEAAAAAAEVTTTASAAAVAKDRAESMKRQMEEALAAQRSSFETQEAQHAKALNALQKRCDDATSSALKSNARLDEMKEVVKASQEALMRQSEESKTQASDLQAQLEQMRCQSEAEQAKSKQAIVDADEKHKVTSDALKSDLRDALKAKNDLESAAEREEGEITIQDILEDERIQHANELDKVRTEVQQAYESQVLRLENQSQELHATIDRLSSDQNQLKRRWDDAQQSLELHHSEKLSRLKTHHQQTLKEWTERREKTESSLRIDVANREEQISSLQQQLFASQADVKRTQSDLDRVESDLYAKVQMCEDIEHRWDMTSARDAAEIASLRQQLAQVVDGLRIKNAHLKIQLKEAKMDAAEQRGELNDLRDMVFGNDFKDEPKPAQGVQAEQDDHGHDRIIIDLNEPSARLDEDELASLLKEAKRKNTWLE